MIWSYLTELFLQHVNISSLLYWLVVSDEKFASSCVYMCFLWLTSFTFFCVWLLLIYLLFMGFIWKTQSKAAFKNLTKRKFSYTVLRNINYYRHFGIDFRRFLEKVKIEIIYGPEKHICTWSPSKQIDLDKEIKLVYHIIIHSCLLQKYLD